MSITGGPAFPPDDRYYGLTILDWFAGQALIGITSGFTEGVTNTKHVAEASYKYAEAMLAEKMKRESKDK